MAAGGQLTNAFDSYDVVGDKEDVSELIDDISPTNTPFISNIGSAPATNTYFEWQEDALATAAENHQIEGFDVTTYTAVTATSRIGNWTSIASKDFVVSGTADEIDKYGRSTESGYQAARRALELKRDVETNALANNAAVAGNSTTARETGGLSAFLKTNVDMSATNGVTPVWTSAPTDARSDGTTRTFTEAMLRTVVLSVWEQGGEPTLALLPGAQKQTASAFAGIAAQRYQAPGGKQTTIIAGAEIYLHDFGELMMVPSRFGPSTSVFVVDPEGARRRILRPYQAEVMAKTGDSRKMMFLCEEGLECQEKRHGIIADLA